MPLRSSNLCRVGTSNGRARSLFVASAVLAGACSGHDGTAPFDASASAGNGDSGALATFPSIRDDASAPGLSCASPGATLGCCGAGTSTCVGAGEFAAWGPCVDASGHAMTCTYSPSTHCGVTEFGPACDDASGPPVVSISHCEDPEFAAECDAGVAPGDAAAPGTDAAPPAPDAALSAPDAAPPPMPAPLPPVLPALCTDKTFNSEPEILGGYSPAAGESVDAHGQIKVWVSDEHPAFVAPGEVADPGTGIITTAGDRTAEASDHYLFEPALYIAPASAESGGTPHFPAAIKGSYNNSPQTFYSGGPGARVIVNGAAIDPAPSALSERYDTEFIWNVQDLGLAAGTYIGEFLVHDGDRDRAVGCVTITVAP